MSSHRAPRRPLPRRTVCATALAVLAVAAVSLVALGVVDGGSTAVTARGLTGHSSVHGSGQIVGSPVERTGGVTGHSSPHAPPSLLAGGALRASGAATAEQVRGRERAVSRDSTREARQVDTSKRLLVAAERDAKVRRAALARQSRDAHRQAHRIAANAWQLPVTKGVYHLTARFGSCSGLWSHCHTGLDFAAPTGTPIHAVASGTITETGWAGAYGNRTIMTLPDGTELWYAHQTAYVVHVGQKVTAGQVIGLVGSTGNTTGPHVHLEVRPHPKTPIDPYAALVAHGLHP